MNTRYHQWKRAWELLCLSPYMIVDSCDCSEAGRVFCPKCDRENIQDKYTLNIAPNHIHTHCVCKDCGAVFSYEYVDDDGPCTLSFCNYWEDDYYA